jgi:hypothetical protein
LIDAAVQLNSSLYAKSKGAEVAEGGSLYCDDLAFALGVCIAQSGAANRSYLHA